MGGEQLAVRRIHRTSGSSRNPSFMDRHRIPAVHQRNVEREEVPRLAAIEHAAQRDRVRNICGFHGSAQELRAFLEI